jgi:uncharacterized repeat protein (TIGR01451 family)
MENVIPGKAIITGITTILIGIAAIVAGVAFLLSLSLSLASPVGAYMYGEEQPTSQLIVDKQITTSENINWQDNLPATQEVLREGDLVKFKITIKNSGDKDLINIEVIDSLPEYLTPVFNPGEYDQENNKIKWKIEKLNAGDQKTFEIRAHIDSSNQELIEGTQCLINKVEAVAETGESDQDTSSFCITTPQVLPEAGSGVSEILVGTGFAAMIGLAGVILRKFGRGQI